MADFRDVEVRIFAPTNGNGNAGAAVSKVEARVDGSGLWGGESKFDFDSLDPSNPEEYGKELGKQLANPNLVRALDQAGITQGTSIRLRLFVDDNVNAPHWVRWERAWLPVGGAAWRLAVNPQVAFSRYIDVQRPDEEPPAAGTFRLLFAVSNPTGLTAQQQINVESEIAAFMVGFENGPVDRRLQVSVLPGRTPIPESLQSRIKKQGWTLVGGNSTLQNISRELHQNYHGLHILAHGDFDPEEGGSLLLENDDGGRIQVNDQLLQSWVIPSLQLIFFQACLSAGTPGEGQTPFTGLAPRMIKLGLPAAVAMQDYVLMDDARVFVCEFYRSLLDDGLVDVAVNRGRQLLIQDAIHDNWSIPALFTRLRGGRLWQRDPLRQAVLETLEGIVDRGDEAWPVPVIEHVRGVPNYDPLVGASGPRFDYWSRIRTLARTPQAAPGAGTAAQLVVLTGTRGSSKASQLRRLFRQAATEFLRSEPGAPLPVWLTLADLGARTPTRWRTLQKFWQGEVRSSELTGVEGRQFLFLIDGGQELAGSLNEAVRAVDRLKALGGSIILMADETLLPALGSQFAEATLLVLQPLDRTNITSYLESLDPPHREAAIQLRDEIAQRGYFDIASQPRFLGFMLEMKTRGMPLRSRRAILQYAANFYLSRLDTRRVPRVCAVDAIERLAWELQDTRRADLPGTQIYKLLNEARSGREFPLADLMQALRTDCRLLLPSGDEGVRFAYPALESYFAAQYLTKSPDRQRLLEDITASLGRHARLRRWEKVLVLCASMLESPAELLNTVLAGSSLMEGEQLFLAVRCYQEALAEHPAAPGLDGALNQMVDTLIWRSESDPHRPYGDRRKALGRLIELAVVCPTRRADIVPHLVELACDPLARSGNQGERPQYDWSGIRHAAASGLFRIYKEAQAFVTTKRPDLMPLLQAWTALAKKPDGNPDGMKGLLLEDDPKVSVVAALALAQSANEANWQTLLDAYEVAKDPDVKWGIADALSGMEAHWLHERVIQPWMGWPSEEPAQSELRRCHVCYLIQKTSLASDAGLEYLRRCLLEGSPALKGRAVRALGKLQDPEIENWLRPACEAIVRRRADELDASKIRMSADGIEHPSLQRAVLEGLRDIGNAQSLEVLRAARDRYQRDKSLRTLSFQVAEEMFWRITGGMEKESFQPQTN